MIARQFSSTSKVEWHPTEQFPEPGPVHGHEGMRRFFASFEQVFGEVRMEPSRIERGAEPGEVFVVIEMLARGKGSGAEVTIRIAHRLKLRDGKVVWGKVYGNAEEGLRAAGLEPSA
ncbi:MAG: nuclear transport factor 2 family protein [Solirubrobacterales bacterium]